MKESQYQANMKSVGGSHNTHGHPTASASNRHVITIMGVSSPFILYYISRGLGYCISRVGSFLWIPWSTGSWSKRLHLIMLKDHFTVLARYILAVAWRDGPSPFMPLEEFNTLIFSLLRVSYCALGWYSLHNIVAPSAIFFWIASHLTNYSVLLSLFIFASPTQRAITNFREACGLTLQDVVWKGIPFLNPWEFWFVLDGEDRMTLWNSVILSALGRTIGMSKTLRAQLRGFWSSAPRYSHLVREPYTFEPLDANNLEIRLLCVEKKFYGAPICTLINVPLQQAPSYEAMSYTWDDQKTDQEIVVSGSQLLVTCNASKIIHERASWRRVRWLWIDAICINQHDDLEKSSQVSIMGQIYRSARIVTVWLGNSDATLTDALLASALLEAFGRLRTANPGSTPCKKAKLGTPNMWQALDRLMTQNYWFRVWIIQEISQAKNVQVLYGGIHFSGGTFATAAVHGVLRSPYRQLVAHCGLISRIDLLKMLSGIHQLWKISCCAALLTGQHSLDVEDVLSTTIQAGSKDPRDQIYGLYSIVQQLSNSDDIIKAFEPDYGKSSENLYFEVAEKLFHRDPEYVLSRAGIGYSRRVQQIPSWIPDWSEKRDDPSITLNDRENKLHERFRYRAGDNQPFSFEVRPDRILQVPCIFLGTVSAMSEMLYPVQNDIYALAITKEPNTSILNLLDSLRKYNDAINQLAGSLPNIYAPTGQPRAEAIWRTIIGDRIAFGLKNYVIQENASVEDGFPAPREVGELYEAWCQWIINFREDVADKAGIFSIILDNSIKRGAFTITSNGLMATIPPLASRGDHVCVIPGLSRPIILRAARSHAVGDMLDSWKFVGECFVHGFMAGEIFNGQHNRSEVLIE